jgi:hypothetical protein
MTGSVWSIAHVEAEQGDSYSFDKQVPSTCLSSPATPLVPLTLTGTGVRAIEGHWINRGLKCLQSVWPLWGADGVVFFSREDGSGPPTYAFALRRLSRQGTDLLLLTSCIFLYYSEVDIVSEVDVASEFVVPEFDTENHCSIQALTLALFLFVIHHVFHIRMLPSAWLLFGLCDANFVEKRHFPPWLSPGMELWMRKLSPCWMTAMLFGYWMTQRYKSI